MTMKLLMLVSILAVSSICFDANETQAQGRRNRSQGYRNRSQTKSQYRYPASRITVYSNSGYGSQLYTPYTGYSFGYGNYNGYGYPWQNGYSNYSYPRGNRYMGRYGNYGYPSCGGIRIGMGTGRIGNQGYRRFGSR